MYPETCKFYTIVYSLVVLWCCTIRVNGDNDSDFNPMTISYSSSNIDLLKLLSGNLSEIGVNPLNVILSVNISAKSINFNIPLNFSDLNTNKNQDKKPIKTVRDDYTLKDGIGYYKFHKTELNWHDAWQDCITENAHLAVVNSEEEEKALRQLMEDNGDGMLVAIGKHDDMYDDGRCPFLSLYVGLLKRNCNLIRSYICEIPL